MVYITSAEIVQKKKTLQLVYCHHFCVPFSVESVTNKFIG